MQESFTIEPMNPNEAEEIAAMHKQSWRDTYLSPENGVDEEWLDATIDKKFDDTYVPRLKKNIEINSFILRFDCKPFFLRMIYVHYSDYSVQ